MGGNAVEVQFVGVREVGPEQFPVMILAWREQGKIIPIWLGEDEGNSLTFVQRFGDRAFGRRPAAIQVLSEALDHLDSGTAALVITSYFEGVFVAEIRQQLGTTLDCRPSDLAALAVLKELPILVEEDVLAQTAVRISPEELARYVNTTLPEWVPSFTESLDGEGWKQYSKSIVDDDYRQLLIKLGKPVDDTTEE